MDKEKQEEIFALAPNLYVDKDLPKNETCMYYGLAVNDGWYEIVKNLSIELEKLLVQWIKENPEKKHPRALQVKEKYARLTFYFWAYGENAGNVTDEMKELISDAQNKSLETCERCGEAGSSREDGWKLTLCDECHSPEKRKIFREKELVHIEAFIKKLKEERDDG